MKKRFTDTEKWSNPWFRKLTPIQKLFWLYLCDRCDNSGVIDLDEELAAFQIGTEINAKEMLPLLGHRIIKIKRGKIWIECFVDFQCGKLSAESKPHVHIMNLLKKHGVWLDYLKGMDTPKEREEEEAKEEDKDMDKDKDTDKEEDRWNDRVSR